MAPTHKPLDWNYTYDLRARLFEMTMIYQITKADLINSCDFDCAHLLKANSTWAAAQTKNYNLLKIDVIRNSLLDIKREWIYAVTTEPVIEIEANSLLKIDKYLFKTKHHTYKMVDDILVEEL